MQLPKETFEKFKKRLEPIVEEIFNEDPAAAVVTIGELYGACLASSINDLELIRECVDCLKSQILNDAVRRGIE